MPGHHAFFLLLTPNCSKLIHSSLYFEPQKVNFSISQVLYAKWGKGLLHADNAISSGLFSKLSSILIWASLAALFIGPFPMLKSVIILFLYTALRALVNLLKNSERELKSTTGS